VSSILFRLPQRAVGVALFVAGGFAIAAPVVTGEWAVQLLSIPLFLLGIAESYAAFRSADLWNKLSTYVPSLVALGASLVLFVSPSLVLNSLPIVLVALLTADGVFKVVTALISGQQSRPLFLINGLVECGLALLVWFVSRWISVAFAIGLAVGGFSAMSGWRLLFMPQAAGDGSAIRAAESLHPDEKLGLGPNEAFAAERTRARARSKDMQRSDLMWIAAITLVFFAIHIGRMPTSNSWLGFLSPFVATGGDLFLTVLAAVLLLLPLRLLWRRLTRPVERFAWGYRIGKDHRVDSRNAFGWLLERWTETRFDFSMELKDARASLPAALHLLLRLGLPIAAVFVAINPIWGFSWYFNTESWASGVYQKMTELRVDPWRVAMVDAVLRAVDGDLARSFQVHPAGVDGPDDFSFLVIGDPGEGDHSQYALIERYLELGRRSDVKFLLISSDVIYPAGSMADYEFNFYFPFKGPQKPIYAIPGNHDWFDALEGFNANFLEPRAARAALEARVDADLRLTSTNTRRIDTLIRQADRLRNLYNIDNNNQRGPFFEIQTPDFALIAIDTGIQRTVDERQWSWLQGALDRARGKFIMAIVGHPRFAGGKDTSIGDEKFAALYQLLESRGVTIAMAGDTHDFEYYKTDFTDSGGSSREMHYFVNGGGGAYLSIGTAFDWPDQPTTVRSWAFYPKLGDLKRKLDSETPLWKRPFLFWLEHFGAWPISTAEPLSGIFDFNRAPYFQSFIEVRVERSAHRVRLILHGTIGPLLWRDLQLGGGLPTADTKPDDRVEFVIPMVSQ
jgi:uncharacterized membrane protein HdeD (DUF308 family)